MGTVRSSSCIVTIALVATLVGACGPSQPKTNTQPPPPIALDVADEGDLEGNAEVFERRLAGLDPSHEKYAPTLERLALAYVELADAKRAEAESATDDTKREAALAAAKAADAKAMERFEQLVATFAEYEGTPSSLLLLAYAYRDRGQAEKRREALRRLVEEYPGTPWAADALVLMADEKFEAGAWAEAETLYMRAALAEPTAPRAAYAIHRKAWCMYRKGELDAAFDVLQEAVRHEGAEEAGIDDVVRRDLVLFYAARGGDAAGARDVLGPYARSDEELDMMIQLLDEVLRSTRQPVGSPAG